MKSLNWKGLFPLLSAGILVAGISPLLLYPGQEITSATNSSFIFQLAPIFAAILSITFIKEKIKKFFWLSLSITLIGLFLLTTRGGLFSPNLGDLLVLLVAFLFGAYNVIAKRYTLKISNLTLSNLRIFFGALFVILIVWITLGSRAFEVLVNFPIIILICSLIIYFYVFSVHVGIKNLGASNNSAIFVLTALFSAIFAFFILGETFVVAQIIGILLMVSGLYLLIKKGV